MPDHYETVIGLEIHAELSTRTKAFCACAYHFGGEVNTQCCPACMGMPGTLPVLNKKVVDYALMFGLAAGCTINKISKFDRKNYFYPDLAKGYQITQAEIPVCQNGAVVFYHLGEKRTVRLTRVHIEEDTAKLLHEDAFKGTLIDFNRSGVPLIEIVSEPDLRSAEEAKDYLEAVRMLLVTLGICNGKMQEGTIRCDVNVSLRPRGSKVYGTRVEMKNVNSFSGAMAAIAYEANRQRQMLVKGMEITQETRRWDEHKNISVPMRTKEDAADYRYFPEPDLPLLVIGDDWLNSIKAALPELPVHKYDRYKGLGVSEPECRALVEHPDKAAYFEECIKIGAGSPKVIANWIFGVVSAWLNKTGADMAGIPVSPQHLCEIIQMVEKGTISNDSGKLIIDQLFIKGGTPLAIVQSLSLEQVSDETELRELVATVLSNNTKSVNDYKNGKTNALTYIAGQCMKASKGKGNPQLINKILRELLN
jgi:aspartyl-tRNA(Asn)/glutamyl-tRNA(Gln) amidotransferase subunit B